MFLRMNIFAVVVVLFAMAARADDKKPAATTDKKLADLLEPIRKRNDVPALAVGVISSQGLKYVAAVGVRKRGDKTPVTTGDLFHLGSDTKAMTATLIATLVEAKKLRWNLTLAEAFPQLKATMAKDVGGISLEHLLTHRAGLPANAPGGWWKYAGKTSVDAQRRKCVAEVVKLKLNSKPGTKYVYSNLGYVIAAAMAERVTKKPWEKLIVERVFKPLKMKQYGFGPVGSVKNVQQPWPHNAKGVAFPPSKYTDNPPIVGPAGRVHTTIADWSKFLADQLRGAGGKDGLLKVATYKKLHTPQEGHIYVMGGWLAFSGGQVLAHDGSNTYNYCTAFLIPKADIAVVVLCNQGGSKGQAACGQAVNAVLRFTRSHQQ